MSCLCFEDETGRQAKSEYHPKIEYQTNTEEQQMGKQLQKMCREAHKEVAQIMENVQSDVLGLAYQRKTKYMKVHRVSNSEIKGGTSWAEFMRTLNEKLLLAFGTSENGRPRALAEQCSYSDVRIEARWPAEWNHSSDVNIQPYMEPYLQPMRPAEPVQPVRPCSPVVYPCREEGVWRPPPVVTRAQPDYTVDLKRDRVLELLQQRFKRPPMATAWIDVNGDGRADYVVTGRDRNRDGIPDVLEERPPLEPLWPAVAPLRVAVLGARRLRNADIRVFGSVSDPYCRVRIKGQPSSEVRTKVINNSLNPTWNFETIFPNYSPGTDLEFEVLDSDTLTKDDFLGSAVLPFSSFAQGGYDGELPLSNSGNGTACLTVKVSRIM